MGGTDGPEEFDQTEESGESDHSQLVFADVGPLQTGDLVDFPASVTVDWEIRNAEEERRLEAIAAGLSGGESDDVIAEVMLRAGQDRVGASERMRGEVRVHASDLLVGGPERVAVAEKATRCHDQVEVTWSNEAVRVSRSIQTSTAEFFPYLERVIADADAPRGLAGEIDSDRFAGSFASEDVVAAVEGLVTAEEHENVTGIENRTKEQDFVDRYCNEEARMRFTEEINERVALNEELVRVKEQLAAAAQDPKQRVLSMPESDAGWFRRFSGHDHRRQPPAVEAAAKERDDGGKEGVPVDEKQPEHRILPTGMSAQQSAEDSGGDDDLVDGDQVLDLAAFTSEQYIQATTEEYAELAEAVAETAAVGIGEQAAVAASIPGLESGVVGLEDVVPVETGESLEVADQTRSDLPLRIGTGIVLLALFFGSLLSEVAVGLFLLVVLCAATYEFYTVLVREGYRPVTFFGFLGTIGALVGTWLWGVGAVPISIASTLVATALLMGILPQKSSSLESLALTVGVMAWVGGLGAFVFPLISSVNYRWLVSAVVVTTALMDVVQYSVGKRIGRIPISPEVSPNKTIEGLVGGIVAAIVTGIAFGFFEPFDMVSGFILGVVIAAMSPFGDLAVSVVKRALRIKDMGGLLPGHGGVLDRVDAMIIVLPPVWILFRATGLL